MLHEEPFIESLRSRVVEQYAHTTLGSGSVGGCFGSILCHELHRSLNSFASPRKCGCFGSILCHELHHGRDGGGLHFLALAAKWGIPVSVLGMLIADHCNRLEPLLEVNHDYRS